MSNEFKHLYEFDVFRFDALKRVLWRNGDVVTLPPKATEVLGHLLASHGNLVERDELIQLVWPDTFVEEGNLNHAISTLRKTIGGNFIQTIARRGYRFTGDVREFDGASIMVERQRRVETVIEETEELVETSGPSRTQINGQRRSRIAPLMAAAAILVLAAGAAIYRYTSARSTRGSVRTLAVLPLGSFSKDGSDEELRLRITDAVITKLGRIKDLVVRPTNSVLRFGREPADAVEAGKALAVDAVLDGRVQQENGRLRVTLQLISVPDGDQLWSEQFDGAAGEILALQDKISERFRGDLAMAEPASETQPPAVNNEAYEAYLKGRFLWNQRKRESYYRAIEYFERSVAIDPTFALGYSGISDCYHLLQQRNELSTEDAFAKAEPAARRALELDPGSAEAHVSMGSVNFIGRSRWSEAEKYYRRAIELNPNLAEPHARLGMLLNAWGRFDEAHAVLKKAEELDPTSVNNAIYLGANYYFSRQFDLAEAQFKRILEFAPGTERAHFFLERIYELTGRPDLAVEHALKEREISHPESVEPLTTAYEKGGIRSFWDKQLEILIDESRTMRGLENHIASRYVLIGQPEKACDQIEINLKNAGTMRNYGRVDPIFDPLNTFPRYRELMQRYAPEI